jgi:hypothetical protein
MCTPYQEAMISKKWLCGPCQTQLEGTIAEAQRNAGRQGFENPRGR